MLIINTEKTVSKIQREILTKCDEFIVQVGYFWFSGFDEIFKSLKDKKIKIIIGINYDQQIYNLTQSSSAIKQRYFNFLSNDINTTEILDQKIRLESHSLFVKKIKDGSLEIRCDPEKNDHSKFFIFKFKKELNNGGSSPGTVLAGSSNFSRSGFLTELQKNNNYLFNDKESFDAHLERFNESWKKSIPIVSKDNFDEFDNKVIKKTWINKTPKPYLLFLKVLDEYFQNRDDNKVLMPKDLSSGQFFNVKYQEDAIVKGLDIIKKHQGVIIADVVGLGKSIVASAIAKNLGHNTIVVCPPHLIDQWQEYMNIAGVPAMVISRGKIQDTFRFERPNDENTIILDEAHYYRNDLTIDYGDLHKLCAKNKVILLSATPFNNKPQDIFNMIKLFQIPTKSSLQTIENLSEEFKDLIKEYNSITKLNPTRSTDFIKIKEKRDKIANQMRTMLSPIVIRRSRLDLMRIDRYKKDLERQKISFPKVNDPELIEYDLGEITELYIDTLNIIAPKSNLKEYTGARYKPTTYIKSKYILEIAERAGVEKELLKKTQENMDDFIKRLLVRRFESCIESFLKTLDAIISSNQKVKEYYEKYKIVPIYK
ncbi:SNF2-related protein, partial [Candidatus Pelagibacter sp.]|nr:SNF2-related protein [Candidatus Pelagibacter sp.]